VGKPAAKLGDRVVGLCVHFLNLGEIFVPIPLPFYGTLTGNLSRNVKIEKRPAAIFGSTVNNTPPHPPFLPYVRPPNNQGRVLIASFTVFINGRPAARAGDLVLTCSDIVVPSAIVQATSTVRIGG
jgi:uncharacterized Zn-binding protein involved in type VI secretion